MDGFGRGSAMSCWRGGSATRGVELRPRYCAPGGPP